MPAFSQSEMAVDAKAIRSLYSQNNPALETCYSVIRPLGSLRNDGQGNQRRYHEKLDDDCYSLDFNGSDSDDNHLDEIKSSDRVNMTTTESFLQQTEDPRNSRIGSATQRSLLENTKPIRTKKRVIQLPMLKLNLDAITGAKNNDDIKTLENTRRSLKTLIDDGKKAIKPRDINNEYLRSSDKNKDQSKESKSVDTLCAVRTLSLNGDRNPSTDLPSVRKVSRSAYINQDAIYSVALTNAVDMEDPDYMQLTSRTSYGDTDYNSFRSLPQDLTHDDLSIDLVGGSDTSKPSPVTFYDMATWPSYDEVQNVRSTGNYGCSKHALLLKKHRFQQELTEQRIRARRDQSRSWVNINTSNYKTNPAYKGNKKLDPICVPTQYSADHCPMCNMYRVNKVSTPCPPNSPKEKNNDKDPTQLGPIIENVDEQNSYSTQVDPQTPMSPSSPDRYQDLNKLAPVTAASLAKTQGFRGSKPPITFMMCYSKGAT